MVIKKFLQKLKKVERRYRKRDGVSFTYSELLRAVMGEYISSEIYAEHRSDQLIKSYETWLQENGYKTSFLSVEDYNNLQERILALIESGEPNVMMVLRADGVTTKIIADETLQEIIKKGYEQYAEMYK